MSKLKYRVGDKVLIKSLDWYNENKDENGDVPCGEEYNFVPYMSKFCGKILTIDVDFEDETYLMKEDDDGFVFTIEMFECKVEKEMKLEDELLNKYEEPTDRAFKGGYEKCKSDIELNGFQLPEGYIFKDENGNEILTSKIILEKKKKEVTYPKTYEECAKLLNTYCGSIGGYNWKLLSCFQKLLICRDAYWKLYGEEMGLGKPWEPDWRKERYIMYWNQDDIIGGYREAGCVEHHIFEFPTPEMRDAFKENFDSDIKICKEFL